MSPHSTRSRCPLLPIVPGPPFLPPQYPARAFMEDHGEPLNWGGLRGSIREPPPVRDLGVPKAMEAGGDNMGDPKLVLAPRDW